MSDQFYSSDFPHLHIKLHNIHIYMYMYVCEMYSKYLFNAYRTKNSFRTKYLDITRY